MQASGRMQLAMFSSVLYILLISLSFGYAADKIPLYFSFITAKTGGFISSGSIPIIDKALEQINSRSDILENYILQYNEVQDSNVSLLLFKIFVQCTCINKWYFKEVYVLMKSVFLMSSYGAPLAQRASYLALHSSLFGPDGVVNYMYD